MLIFNGHVLTMDGAEYEVGFVRTEGAAIKEVGEGTPRPMADEMVVDACGGYILPGFVDAHSHIGMWEDSLNFEGADGNEDSDPITPQMRAIDGVNPMDRAFREALASGVTTVVTGPGSANPIGGQFIAMKTHGVCVDDMVIKAPCAMKMALGENPKSVYHEKNQAPTTRMGTAALIREVLTETENYMEKWEKYLDNPEEEDRPDKDLKKEALAEVLRGNLPVKIHAHRADDIFTAIRLAKEFGFHLTLEHATDGHLIAEKIKESGVGVCVGPFMGDRSKPELQNLSVGTAKILVESGIPTAIISDHPETPEKYLSLSAALCVREGMDKMDALCAITASAARLSGIFDRVGSLSVGKDADILVFDSFPLSFEAKLQTVVLGGEIMKIS